MTSAGSEWKAPWPGKFRLAGTGPTFLRRGQALSEEAGSACTQRKPEAVPVLGSEGRVQCKGSASLIFTRLWRVSLLWMVTVQWPSKHKHRGVRKEPSIPFLKIWEAHSGHAQRQAFVNALQPGDWREKAKRSRFGNKRREGFEPINKPRSSAGQVAPEHPWLHIVFCLECCKKPYCRAPLSSCAVRNCWGSPLSQVLLAQIKDAAQFPFI